MRGSLARFAPDCNRARDEQQGEGEGEEIAEPGERRRCLGQRQAGLDHPFFMLGQARDHPALWNVYVFHCSDGDNFESDNEAALKAAKELTQTANLFGYGEIKPLGSRYYESSMLNIFRRLDSDNFHTVLIERKEDIWPSFKAFLGRDRALAEG